MNNFKNKSGTFLFDKPYRWTSFDVVNKVRSMCKQTFGERLKVGHAGTLDPLATGLLIVCIGQDTKTIDQYSKLDKEYIATINISATTASYDLEKPIEKHFDYSSISAEQISRVLQSFIGVQQQLPPSFSAKWINGKRAYNIARQGQIPKLKSNQITIYEIELLRCELPEIEIRVKCSKGTYIRSLVRDIGQMLSGGAFLSSLKRISIGEYSLKDSISFDKFADLLKKQKLVENL
ncbi:MAG: tRNA pseudouridine(55) synthase TruB [Bacteroidales bacterium]